MVSVQKVITLSMGHVEVVIFDASYSLLYQSNQIWNRVSMKYNEMIKRFG